MRTFHDAAKVRSYIQRAIIVWETVLALIVLAGVVAGSLGLASYLKLLLRSGSELHDPYTTLQGLIGHVLMLVVGLELAMMLIRHTPGSVIEVLMYVAARKMLGPQTTVAEFLAGTAAIAGLFAVRKYLFVARMDVGDHVFGAATPVSTVCQNADVHIPGGIAKTIGGVVARLAEDQGVDIVPHRAFLAGDARIEVATVVDGLVETVKVGRASDGS